VRIDIVTLFPEMFAGPFDASIVGRARSSGAVEIALHNLRDYTTDRHYIVDDYAYGGGPGMVMKPEPLFACVEAVRSTAQPAGTVVLLTPQGRLLSGSLVRELAAHERLIIICGHYEGVDERVREKLADIEVSIGDYVLSGGEPAAIVLVDALVRRRPGVLGSDQSLAEESHEHGLLEYPQYTRPEEFRGMRVPPVLLSGNHADIARWRREQSIIRTARRRPDMLERARLSPHDRRIAAEALGEAPAAARIFRVIMPADDLDACVRFYAAVLARPGERVAPGRHYFDCGAVILAVVQHAADAPGHNGPPPNPDHVYFAVSDLKAMHGRVKAAGPAWVEARIRRRPWGERSFYARDPARNPICFVDEETCFTGGRFVP
jgi:tRNA (guanine37-N1)-methyltransferase